MRAIPAALAFTLACAPGAAAKDNHDIAGAWRGEEVGGATSIADYLLADLDVHEGRVVGGGHINLCAGCRGFDQYAIDWEGRVWGDRIELRGTYPDRDFEPDVQFAGRIEANGERIVGVLSNGRVTEDFVLVRARDVSGQQPDRESP
ncbi:hypothetical protein [Vitreimonas sp.]|uniref:hypothetical protein n=1 Tax=Vitreimonas sp. TaxID=3069702 RepID=UPI002D7974AE|nr:hypothetical protein [Vitreimonas sp.]